MPNIINPIPLSLYIHIPWCVRKCPYCDFNSHEMKSSLPEELYARALIHEFDMQRSHIEDRSLISIFFGGGTPSLFSAETICWIIDQIAKRVSFSPTIEITLEANPGTLDQSRFAPFYDAGINRLSIGVQSFNETQLKKLGRIHDKTQAINAIEAAKTTFNNINLDIMYGLPNQTVAEALDDISLALSFQPTHFSWYQLTIEPNTLFYRTPPTLPLDDDIWQMHIAGQTLLTQFNYLQYEVSAYSLSEKNCVHNKNYWEFGDYLGIGAGAHSKLTNIKNNTITRFAQVKHPKDYLDIKKRSALAPTIISDEHAIFEFMLNALRLTQGVPITLFTERTMIPVNKIESLLTDAHQKGLLIKNKHILCASKKGKRFLNDLIALFL